MVATLGLGAGATPGSSPSFTVPDARQGRVLADTADGQHEI